MSLHVDTRTIMGKAVVMKLTSDDHDKRMLGLWFTKFTVIIMRHGHIMQHGYGIITFRQILFEWGGEVGNPSFFCYWQVRLLTLMTVNVGFRRRRCHCTFCSFQRKTWYRKRQYVSIDNKKCSAMGMGLCRMWVNMSRDSTMNWSYNHSKWNKK